MAFRPSFRITPELLQFISTASEIKAWISQAVVDVPWLPVLQQDATTRLSHSSTSIEGNPLTLTEVQAVARGEEIGAPAKTRLEVQNYMRALQSIGGTGGKGRFREIDLLRLHRMITQGLVHGPDCGHYKTRPNRIIGPDGYTVHTPPPPGRVKILTRELLFWINSPMAHRLHALITSAIAHHRLVSIHPFADGNGRVSRAFAVWILWARNFDTHHIFALDEYFEQDRQTYYDKIQQARDLDDDLTYWLEYAAKGIVETLKQTRRRIESLRLNAKAPKTILTRQQENLLRLLRDNGRMRSPEMEKTFRVTRARVGQILKPLIRAGLIVKEGQTRATAYRLG